MLYEVITMGILDFTTKACDTYTGLSYDAYKQLRSLENLTRGPYNDAARNLRKIQGKIPSIPGLVDSALNSLEFDLNSAIPDLSDFSVIADIITKCTPLKNLLSGTGSLTDARITSYNVCYTKLLRLKHEQPHHRMMVSLRARGRNNFV